MAWLRQRTPLGRPPAALVAAGTCWTVGIVTVLSFNRLAWWRSLATVPGLDQANAYEALDHLSSNVMLPLSGFCLAMFVGWVAPEHALREELQLTGGGLRLLRGILRYVVPALILVQTLASISA